MIAHTRKLKILEKQILVALMKIDVSSKCNQTRIVYQCFKVLECFSKCIRKVQKI